MSTLSTTEVVCPRCYGSVSVTFVDSLNVAARPEARTAILEGRFQRVGCPAGHSFSIESAFVYSDSGRGQLLYVVPLTEEPRIEAHLAAFAEQIASLGSAHPWAASYAAEAKQRVVLGYASLREKLRIWDAGLDDVDPFRK